MDNVDSRPLMGLAMDDVIAASVDRYELKWAQKGEGTNGRADSRFIGSLGCCHVDWYCQKTVKSAHKQTRGHRAAIRLPI